MTKAPLHITLAQINPTVGDLACNLGKIRKIRDNAPDNTDLIVFPEMVVCGYPPEDLVLKPFFLDKIEESIQSLVQESANHKAFMLISTPWRIDGKIYNAVHLIGDGEIQNTILKHNLANGGIFDEVRIFESSALASPVDFKGHKLGVIICEDMWSPDAAEKLKSDGADLLISINASPYEIDKDHLRQEQARARINETGLPLIYVNQCGGQDELVFDGASFIMNTDGEITEQLAEFEEEIRHVTTHSDSAPLNKKELNINAQIYKALTTGLRDYISKNNFPGVLIGLSGGIDSALTAAIAVDALGKAAVHCVMMPSKYTSQDSLDDAKECAKNLGVHYDIISIESAVDTFEEELTPHLNKGTPETTHQNIQSRCRGLILMALSNSTGKMVLSTGNKSEMAVGYATLYGDMCGGFNVLKDVYKTQAYDLSRWRNEQELIIPERIITKAPTAELKENQTDQDSLPPYEELDDILHCLIEKDLSASEIINKGHKAETVQKIWHMLERAEYKRRQAPPGVKITSRAFGRDRRYPITNGFMKMIEK